MQLQDIISGFMPSLFEAAVPAKVEAKKAFWKGLEKYTIKSGKINKKQAMVIKNQIDKAIAIFEQGLESTIKSPNPFNDEQGNPMPYNCHIYKSANKNGDMYNGDFWVLGGYHVFWRKYPKEGQVEFFGFGYPQDYGF